MSWVRSASEVVEEERREVKIGIGRTWESSGLLRIAEVFRGVTILSAALSDK